MLNVWEFAQQQSPQEIPYSSGIDIPSALIPGAGDDVYVSQSGSGSQSGANAANSHSLSWLNNASNWGTGVGQIGPGDTVHLVGTISSQLTVQGSGTSGSPIVIRFEDDAKFSAATFSSYCIYMASRDYIVIDGGSNGIIECTDNGSPSTTRYSDYGGGYNPQGYIDNPFTYQNSPFGVYIEGGSYVEVKNLTIQNLYVRYTLTDDDRYYARCVQSYGAEYVYVHDVTCDNASKGVELSTISGGELLHELYVYDSTFTGCSTAVTICLGTDNSNIDGCAIAGCRISAQTNWDGILPNGEWHHNDGIHNWGRPGRQHDQITNMRIYNNWIGPDIGRSVSGWIYIEFGCYLPHIFNNILFGTSPSYPALGYICVGGTGMSDGNHGWYVYNNTIYDWIRATGILVTAADSPASYIYNNIVGNCSISIAYQEAAEITACDYNIIYRNTGSLNFGLGGNINIVNQATWEAAGYDQNSVYSIVSLDSEYRGPEDGVWVDAGTNTPASWFSAVGYEKDYTGSTRQANSILDIGAYEQQT